MFELESDEPSVSPSGGSTSDIHPEFDRAARGAILSATVVGAVLRISMLISRWSTGLAFNDSLYYSSQAQQNAHGQWFRLVFTNGPGAEHPPLASLLMTPASLLPHFVFWQRSASASCRVHP